MCVSLCVCQRERIFAWVHVRVGTFVCVCNLCVCVSLLLLASNWIFCPAFCLSLWAEEKQRKGTTPSLVMPFELSPTHLQNKRQGQDWIDGNTRLQLHIRARARTSHHITPFVQVLSVWDWDVSVGLKRRIRCCHSTDRQPHKLQKRGEAFSYTFTFYRYTQPWLYRRRFGEFREC